MLDLKWIRENAEELDCNLKKRGAEPVSATVLKLDSEWRQIQTELQSTQARRNESAKAIGQAKSRGENADELIAEVATLKEASQELERRERELSETLEALLATIPNRLAADVPVGPDEWANEEIRRVGTPRQFMFAPRPHFEIGADLVMMDFEAAGRMSGSRFVVLKGALARLERALAAFMLDVHTGEHGYTEVAPPTLVRDEAVFGTGQLPKFAEDLYRTGEGHWLIPTAEVPLTNLVREQILDEAELPLRYTAQTLCYRSEAGAAGKDTAGMLRQHQFMKVELVSITAEAHSEAEHERMTGCAETILKYLGLPYRVVVLASGDTGFSARKTYDIEVWLPGQDKYREISSCSNCGDFQARRMKARYRPEEGKGTRFVHTLNGSGVAVGRTLIAILENYQEQDGSVTIPDVLRPYMNGLSAISVS